ncbi:hypothetical protein [Merdimonas faecis]|uniref:hypothetical protein n=1 Tax=Merdimonas faecis TaxID=1653435 RepID=UPI0032096479
MERKVWRRPLTEVQKFEANEYVAACGDTNNEYIFKCDAMGGIFGTVYYDNGNGIFDPRVPVINPDGDRLMGSGYHACGEEHITQTGDEFIDGWYITGGDGMSGGEWVRQVVIWRGVEGNNIHCTTNLDKNTWETAKS